MTKSKLLLIFIIVHLTLVLFQIQMKSIILDTTYWRDIVLIPTVILALGLTVVSKKRFSTNGLDLLVMLLAAYGLFHIVIGGYDVLTAGLIYRNHFLPVLLYFAAKTTFVYQNSVIKLTNYFFVIFLVYLLDVFVELGLKTIGVSRLNIPWYSYIARISYRYIGNETGELGYIAPGASGTLGFQGLENASAAVLMVLFAFLLPLIVYGGNVKKISRSPSVIMPIKYSFAKLCIISTAAAVFIFQISTHIIAFFIVLFLLIFLSKQKITKVNTFIFIFLAILTISAFRFQEASLFRRLIGNLVGNQLLDGTPSTLAIIFDSSQITAFFSLDTVSFFTGLGAGESSMESLNLVYGENRLLMYGLQYGVIWLLLILSIYLMAFKYGFALRAMYGQSPVARNTVLGIMLALLVCLLDMSHYAFAMYAPLIDIWAVLLGTLSAMWSSRSIINRLS